MWNITDILDAWADVAQAWVKWIAKTATWAAWLAAKWIDAVAWTDLESKTDKASEAIDNIDLVDSKLDDAGISKKLDTAAEYLVPWTVILKWIWILNKLWKVDKWSKWYLAKLLDKVMKWKADNEDVDWLVKQMEKMWFSPEEIKKRLKQWPGWNKVDDLAWSTYKYNVPNIPKKNNY